MLKVRRKVAIAAVLVAFLGVGTASVAVAAEGGGASPPSRTSTPDESANEAKGQEAPEGQEAEKTSDPEGKDSQATQDAACAKAGVDPQASNINYDDQTGACTLDSGDGGDTE
ncbi:MAG: hypothetical protein QOH68_4065 [Nocardioidaceae bacterium]|jgi:hypothetical protein|nr:hypothetical protein [Nocardioidaceae bacterium]